MLQGTRDNGEEQSKRTELWKKSKQNKLRKDDVFTELKPFMW